MATLKITAEDTPADQLFINGRHIVLSKYREMGGGGRMIDMSMANGQKLSLTVSRDLNQGQIQNMLTAITSAMSSKPSQKNVYELRCRHYE